MKKILIIDDHPAVLEGLKKILVSEGYPTVVANNAAGAYDAMRDNADIDLLMVDLFIEGVADGLDIIKNIRNNRPGIPAIVYTMHDEPWVISLLLECSVDGIVLKRDPIDELLAAVEAVNQGKIYHSPVIAAAIDTLSYSKTILSPKDTKVLMLIAKGENTREIAEHMNLSEKTVEYHRSSIIKRLGAHNMNDAILKAVRLSIIS